MSFGKLLKLEFRKLLNLKIIYVMCAISALLAFIVWRSCRERVEYMDEVCSVSWFVTDQFATSFAPLLLALFVAIFNCQDESEDTLKTIRARGYSSGKIFFAQLVVTCAVTFAYFVFVAAFVALMGLLGNFRNDTSAGDIFRALALRFYCLIALSVFYTFFATLVKKTGGAIAVNVILYAMGMLAVMILDMAVEQAAVKIFSVKAEDLTFKFQSYWILNLVNSSYVFSLSSKRIAQIIIGASVYLVCGVVGGYLLSVKREVK